MLRCSASTMELTVFARRPVSRSRSDASKPARSQRCRSRPRNATSAASASIATIEVFSALPIAQVTRGEQSTTGKLRPGYKLGSVSLLAHRPAQKARHFLLQTVEHGLGLRFRLAGVRGIGCRANGLRLCGRRLRSFAATRGGAEGAGLDASL